MFAGAAGAAALVTVVVGAALGGGPDLPPQTVFDPSFAEQANEVCQELMPPIRADRPEPGPESRRTGAELAPRIERAADGLDRLVVRLDDLAPTAAAQVEIDRWLADWRAYIAVGRQYAATLRAGDDSTGATVGAETGRIGRRLFGFARANDMAACTP
ncbi:MAG: hypothetical protein ABIW46_05385 [Acidimicrobiales bacterium]